MIRVHVICEGQTEEEFIRHILAPALLEKQVSLLPSCIGKVGHKGGNVNLNRLSTDSSLSPPLDDLASWPK